MTGLFCTRLYTNSHARTHAPRSKIQGPAHTICREVLWLWTHQILYVLFDLWLKASEAPQEGTSHRSHHRRIKCSHTKNKDAVVSCLWNTVKPGLNLYISHLARLSQMQNCFIKTHKNPLCCHVRYISWHINSWHWHTVKCCYRVHFLDRPEIFIRLLTMFHILN